MVQTNVNIWFEPFFTLKHYRTKLPRLIFPFSISSIMTCTASTSMLCVAASSRWYMHIGARKPLNAHIWLLAYISPHNNNCVGPQAKLGEQPETCGLKSHGKTSHCGKGDEEIDVKLLENEWNSLKHIHILNRW